ncbi:MAG: hypothetical protein KGZ35_03970 [Truepera sp.]|nr:hypothetical protein [Truepera sp.]
MPDAAHKPHHPESAAWWPLAPLELSATTPDLEAVKRYFEQIADGDYL